MRSAACCIKCPLSVVASSVDFPKAKEAVTFLRSEIQFDEPLSIQYEHSGIEPPLLAMTACPVARVPAFRDVLPPAFFRCAL